MLVATSTFIDALDEWAVALRNADSSGARFRAEHLDLRGELLAIHPDFQRCFRKHCPDIDTQKALSYIKQFIVCATECRMEAQRGK